jgi:hypothetical protein
MKKILFIVAILLSNISFAQKFRAGIKTGFNVSSFTGTDLGTVTKKAIFGLHGGGYLNFSISKFSLQTEALVSTQGAKLDSLTGSGILKLTYLAVPIMLRYRSMFGIVAEIGPQFGFKLDEKVGNSTINDFGKNLDLGFAAGIGWQLKNGLGVGARYTVGLSKVGEFSTSSINPDYKNSVVQISLYIPVLK